MCFAFPPAHEHVAPVGHIPFSSQRSGDWHLLLSTTCPFGHTHVGLTFPFTHLYEHFAPAGHVPSSSQGLATQLALRLPLLMALPFHSHTADVADFDTHLRLPQSMSLHLLIHLNVAERYSCFPASFLQIPGITRLLLSLVFFKTGMNVHSLFPSHRAFT